jgi:cell division protein FtsX
MFEAMRLWMMHPRIRRYIQIDIFVCIVLTFVTALLILVGIQGINYFVQEGGEAGIAQSWSTELIIVLVSVMMFVYLISLYFLIKEQLTRWYKWWRRNVDVHLVLDPSTANANSLNVESTVVTSPEYQQTET